MPMLIKDRMPFVDNTAALPQSADPHLEQQGISITMPNRQQLHIHIYIPSRSSAGHNASIAHLLGKNEISLIVGDINAHHSRLGTNTNEDERGEQLGISHIWRLVNGLSGKQPHNSPNKGVRFADMTYLDPKMIANKFAHQFTPPQIRLTGDKSKRQHQRQFHQLPLTGTPSSRLPTRNMRSGWQNRPQQSDQFIS